MSAAAVVPAFVPQLSAALRVPDRQYGRASAMNGFGSADERLGRVLRDAVEGRGRPVTASLAGTGIGQRAFVAAVERAAEHRRPAGERPRFGAIVVTAAVGAAAAIGLALWPAITAHRAPVPRPAPVAADQRPTAQVIAAPAAAEQAAASPGSVAPPAAAAPPVASAAQPVAPQAASAQAAAAPPPATPAPPAPVSPASPAAAPVPPLTFANHEVVGCCLALGGRWHDQAGGGAPALHGPSAWTANRAATATWSLGSPAGGKRWDSVRVLVWIPDRHAGAVVRFTVTATSAAARTVSTFDVAEHGRGGWLTIPGTFSAGTPAQRTGTITLRMSFLRAFGAGTCHGGTCTDMAAGQARFEWS
jgi:hypothetical protein